MRTIKFRGLRTDGKGWVYGGYFQHTPDEDGVRYYIFDFNEGAVEVIPESVGQFTGLHDKKGKEIYEGDIVDVWSAGSHLPNGIIKFGQGAAKFFIGNESNSICWNLSGGGHNYTQENLEIIGKIFDDNELVKL